MSSFLGRAVGFGQKFLGRAVQGANFLGRALPHVQQAAAGAQRFASNQAVRDIGSRIGLNPQVLRTVGSVAGTIGSGAGMAPGIARDLLTAGRTADASLAGTKRSIADLYRQAQLR